MTELHDARLQLGPATLDDLFPDGFAFRRSVQTYVVLLALAAIIASLGLYQDSVASIIGAMVVAPLGGAIMALAGSLVTGRLRWQGITLLQVVLGALMVVAIGYLVSSGIPNPLTLTPALEARTSPGLADLGVALAAGAAGAWVTVRRTGTDALPGVAIAVSLVPPLATVGICLELGRPADAAGAMVLFLTNLSAILVVACVVFLVTGVRPPEQLRHERRRLRLGFAAAFGLMVLAAVPLASKTVATLQDITLGSEAAPVVETWAAGTGLTLAQWHLESQVVSVSLEGDASIGAQDLDTRQLADELASTLGVPVTVDVAVAPVTKASASASP